MPRYVTVRGTSQLEGYHEHLKNLFVGTNYSALLAGALATYFNFRRGARGGGRPCRGGGRPPSGAVGIGGGGNRADAEVGGSRDCAKLKSSSQTPNFSGTRRQQACATGASTTTAHMSTGCWTRSRRCAQGPTSHRRCQDTSPGTARPKRKVRWRGFASVGGGRHKQGQGASTAVVGRREHSCLAGGVLTHDLHPPPLCQVWSR